MAGLALTGGEISYLDYNAGAPLHPEAAEVVARVLTVSGNPSSVHAVGRAARRLVEEARAKVAAIAGADPAMVIFTSGGTEANNLALRGPGRARVIASAVEHPSVLEAADGIETIPVDGDGIVDLDALAAMLDGGDVPAVVSVMLANNETGMIQPVAEAAARAHERGALVHCDAVQAPGRRRLDMAALGVDMLTLSAHKIGGPKGVGALIVDVGVVLRPVIRGGGQERGRRSGTEDVPGIAGFGAAASLVDRDLTAAAGITALRDRLEERVLREIPAAQVIGRDAPRLLNTSCLALPGVSAEIQVMALDLEGIAVSAGSACSSGKVRESHVLRAMGLPPDIAGSAIRVSLGRDNTDRDIDRFIAAWKAVAARVGRSAA